MRHARMKADGWRRAAKRYRVLLYTAGEERHAVYGGRVVRPGIETSEVEKVIESGGRLTIQQVLRCRVRYFTDGVAIGGKAFVERVFIGNRRFFGPKRRDGARKMRFAEWGDLRTARALRLSPVTVPVMDSGTCGG